MSTIAFKYTESPFSITFNKISRQPLSFKEELVETAKHIKANATKPLMLVMSGGLDAEVAALSFIKAGVAFEALTCLHKSKTNYHDIKYSQEFCERHDINQHFVEIDEEDFFFNKGFEKYIEQGYISNNLFSYFRLFLHDKVKEMGYTGVFGSGSQFYRLNSDGELCLKYSTPIINPLKWCNKNKESHFTNFFLTTPELIASYIKEPLISHFHSNPTYYKGLEEYDYNFEKVILYHNTYSIPNRRRHTGFESMLSKRLQVQAELKKRFPEVSGIYHSLDSVKTQLGIV